MQLTITETVKPVPEPIIEAASKHPSEVASNMFKITKSEDLCQYFRQES